MKISSKWSETVRRVLGPKDEVHKTYGGSLEGKTGMLTMSKRRLVFVEVRGLIRKTHNLVLDLPYEKISKIERTGTYKLRITDEGGRERELSSSIVMSIVERSLRELMESARPSEAEKEEAMEPER